MQLSIKNLNKSFGSMKATNDVSLDIKANSLHSIIGSNGAGKTTLIKQITGEISPDSGSVFLADIDITKWSDFKRARAGLIRVFQISSLFSSLSVLENISLAICAKESKYFVFYKSIKEDVSIQEKAKNILEYLDLSNHKNQSIENLSYGMKKQVELAMALVLKPKVLLLDEPTAGMSIIETKKFIEIIQKIKGDYTILLIEHDMSVVFSLSDEISVLDLGSLIMTDIPSNIKNDKHIQKIYLGEE